MNIANYENKNFSEAVNTIEEKFYPATFISHWHNYVEIIFCTEVKSNQKTAVLQVNLDTFELEPGDILFVWPGELHSIIDNSDRCLCAIQFKSDLISELPDFRSYQSLFRRIKHIRSKDLPDLAHGVFGYLRHIIEVRRDAKPFGGVENLISLYEMFIDLSTHINDIVLKSISGNNTENAQTLEKIFAACLYIQENCTNNITLEDVSNQAGFSPFYFSRIFKNATSYPFTEYLNLQRVKYAQNLLSDSELSITEICYRSGFKSSSTFNRVFRELRGCAPSEYRKYYSDNHE